MLIFISGGVRSGKSSLGEKLATALAGENRKIYLATARHYDEEMTRRIKIHQQERARKGFFTIDKSCALGELPELLSRKDTVLLDCLGTLLANELFDDGGKQDEPEVIGPKVLTDILSLHKRAANLIVISNELFADGVFYDEPIEDYIKTLAQLHMEIARHSNTAIECVYSGYLCHKGQLQIPLDNLNSPKIQ